MKLAWALIVLAGCGGAPCPRSTAAGPAAPPASASAAPPVRSPVVLDGAWRGLLAGRLHLVLNVGREGGALAATLDSVDQGAHLPVDAIALAGKKLHFEIKRVNGWYDGTVDGDAIDGSWTQNGVVQPLAFHKGAPEQAKPAPAKPPLDAPIEVVAPASVIPFRADDKMQVAYELHVTSFARGPISLERVEVTSRGAPVAAFEGSSLASMIAHPAMEEPVGDARSSIPGGRRAIVFVWLTFDGAPPATLDHRVTVKVGDASLSVSDVRVAVGRAAPIVLAPPLRGAGWRAVNGPSNASHHRRAFIPIAGRTHISQRFAIDWVKIGADGKTFSGDPTKNASYHAYGAQALAVADGVVTEVKDGIAENTPGSRAVPITLETIGGNHVVVDLGGGRFGFWAHLQPGSIKVKVGDRVKRGQVLGLVGNTGNSSEPHLHFHVSDATSPLGAEGLPYELDSFEANGVKRTRQLPTEDENVAFP